MSAFREQKRKNIGARLRGLVSNRRGVAILIVIAVLAALVALATPFVMSMVLHGRQARNELTSLQARSGAEAAIAHATAQLYKSALKTDPLSTDPFVTTNADLKVTMDFPAAAIQMEQLGVNVQNTAGVMWNAKVEDEQGKINITTAHPALLGNLMASGLLTENAPKGATQLFVDDASMFRKNGGLIYLNGEDTVLRYSGVSGNTIQLSSGLTNSHGEGALVYDGRARAVMDAKAGGGSQRYEPLRSIYEMKAALGTADSIGPDEFARWERHITVQSGMNGPLWGHGEPQNAPRSETRTTAYGFTVEKGDGFTPGGLFRMVRKGIPKAYGRITSVTLRQDGSASVSCAAGIDFEPAEGAAVNDFVIYQPEFQHPININTATTEVLEAVFTGVCIYGSKEAVSREKAQLLVDMVREKGRVYATSDQLRKVFDEAHNRGLLSIAQRDALYVNATEPNSPRLRTSTVPFVFHTYGHVTIEGSGVVNSENGIQLSRNAQRQLISLPTPWPGHFQINYQREFQELLDKGLGSRVVTFPTPLPAQKLKRMANNVKTGKDDVGGVRLDVGQSGLHGYNLEFYDSCDDPNDPGYRQDGYDMSKRGPFDLASAPNRAGSRGSRVGSKNNNVIRFGSGNNTPPPANQPQAGVNAPYLVASQPTAVEMWYKPLGGGQCVFYDESLEDDRNRVTFSYQPGEGLKVEICDAGFETQNARVNGWTHLQRKPIQYIYPVDLTSGDWHHVAASWKEGGYNGIEIRYDAQPLPPNGTPIIQKPSTRLANSVSLTEVNKIELEEAPSEDFPARGAVQIGEEIIEYHQRQGNNLVQLVRGARMTSATKHDEGEIVVPYGFRMNTRSQIVVGGATLTQNVPRRSEAVTRVNCPSPPAPYPYILQTETKKLPVDDATNFPPSGFIVVGGELIYYGKKTATSFEQLVRNQSSNTGAPARNLSNRADVILASIEISTPGDYPPSGLVQIEDETDEKRVEWIYYAKITPMGGKHYMIAHLHNRGGGYNIDPDNRHVGGNNVSLERNNDMGNDSRFRGGKIRDERYQYQFPDKLNRYIWINPEMAHSKGAKVIPVFEVDGPHCGDIFSPFGEQGVSEVSIMERGQTQGDLMYVKMAVTAQHADHRQVGQFTCPRRFNRWIFTYYVALNDFVSRVYPANRTRILKWPSGELPDAVNAKRIIGANRDGQGQIRGHIDEVKCNILPSKAARIAMTDTGLGITADQETILLEDANAWADPSGRSGTLSWPQSGLIRVEEELMYYESGGGANFNYYADVYQPLDEKSAPPEKYKKDRRWINACSGDHEFHPNLIQGVSGYRLSRIKRGVLGTEAKDHPVGAKVMLMDGSGVAILKSISRDQISIGQNAGFPYEGYVWINDEVISYTSSTGGTGGATLEGIANFRGRFGTREDEHAPGDIVRCLPFRYWDRNPTFEDGLGVAFVQGGYFAQDAIFDSLQLEIKGTDEYPKPNAVRPRIIARFNGKPSWGNEATNIDGGLWEFKNKEGTIPIRTEYGRGIRADQAEVRVYWEYKSGAFIPNSDWKRTFQIEKLGANYKTPLIPRRLDEIERR